MNLRLLSKGKSALAIAAIALLHTGCIEFDRQTVSYRIDTTRDSLLIFQNYHGIYGAEHEDHLSGQEIDQFRSVLEKERTFFFANWIFELNLESITKTAADLDEETADTPNERALLKRAKAGFDAVRDNLTIGNGALYLDPEGRLCGTQTVRIRNLKSVLKAVNDAIAAFLERKLLSSDIDPEERLILEKALRGKPVFISVDGNQIRFRHPLPEKVYRDELIKPNGDEQILSKLARSGIHVAHSDGELRVSIGQVTDEVTHITMDTFSTPYRANALRFTQDEPIPVEPNYDPVAAATKFLGAK
ncbi:MAG: hypothetical protein ISQ14_11685 [Verrucomicrobiae bacterium]|nr:hypothetical protein [Verrucomicrobiae bacterium]